MRGREDGKEEIARIDGQTVDARKSRGVVGGPKDLKIGSIGVIKRLRVEQVRGKRLLQLCPKRK